MIVYFADRTMSVLGHATTNLPNGYVIIEDLKTEDVNTGVASFSCTIGFTAETRAELEVMTNAGNYLLRSNDGENEFYTIIESEIDTLRQEIYIYAEDAGLDLINEIAGADEAVGNLAADYYIKKYIVDSGFEIGINEIPTSERRRLEWEGQSTVTERLASIATQFGGYEIAFSFAIKGLEITHKYVNIYKQRGQDNGVQLRLNKEVDKIITSRSVANLVTAFICTGGVPDDSDVPITLKGYEYDDGDFYVDTNGKLKSRKAVAKWSRYVWNREPNKLDGYEGHIVRPYSYNTTSQSELCTRAITELKKYCDMEVNFEANIKVLPAGVKIGDRVNIIDDAGGLYLSTRLLKLETSITEQKYTATLGEHLIKGSGISQKVADLAAQFSASALSAERALKIAISTKESADTALEEALYAVELADSAFDYTTDVFYMADDALYNANEAQKAADEAAGAVKDVADEVVDLGISIRNIGDTAQEAYEQAYEAIETAELVARSVENAYELAGRAGQSAAAAQKTADDARDYAADAGVVSAQAKVTAGEAQGIANAAKAESSQALKDITSLGTQLTTLSNTMAAEYSKKSDVITVEASLQSQISQNAAGITSNASAMIVIDETANDAQEKAAEAQALAKEAQAEADKATAAAEEAQATATQADAQLKEAKQNLENVKSRVDATEEEIAAAQAAVDAAQAAADAAQEEAAAATESANAAQTVADEATAAAEEAQKTASAAAADAAAAAALAAAATGDASEAKETAAAAQGVAEQAQEAAATAVEKAGAAEEKATQAVATAAEAQAVADAADEKVVSAQEELTEAKQNLEDVKSRIDATEEDIAAAEAAVEEAQAVVDKAVADAEAAQATAEAAQAEAEAAQAAAEAAQAAAEEAQAAAEAAQAAADAAQAAAEALVVRVVKAETDIVQTAEAIKLLATKEEVQESLNGFYTKEESDAALEVSAESIKSHVSTTYATIKDMDEAKAEIVAAAAAAQSTANQAAADALQAQNDLEEAKENLTNVEGRVDATEEEIAAAQAAVDAAQAAAEAAQAAAEAAQVAAEAAQAEADALATRTAVAETWIEQTSEQIATFATKGDLQLIDDNLDLNYYTSEQTDSAITQKANEITQTVSGTYATASYVREVNDTASEALQTANSASSGAEGAYFAALDAAGSAAAAQLSADTASAIANRAEEKADAAQGELTKVSGTVTTHTTQIEQLEDSIKLKASTTEVKDYLAENYYTKTYLDAQFSVEADKIKSSVRESYTSKEEFDNLEIGGANLLANSDVEIYGELKTGSTYAVVKYGDLMPAFDKYGLGVYTLSFDIKAVVEGENKATVFVSCGDGALTSKHTFPNRTMSDVTGEYERRSFSFSPEIENDAGTNSMLKFQSGAGIYVKDVKLEKGTKPTTWTPASEDVYEKIDGVSDSVDDIDKRVISAESTIQQLKDAISMLVIDSNGQSLMTQTSTGWTFSTKSIQEQVNSASENLETLQDEVSDTKSAVEILDEAVKDLGVLSEYIKIGTYTYTDDEGIEQTEPSIDLGETDTGFRLKITNTRILFTDGSDNLVEINSKDKSLDIGKARIKSELQMGGFVWQARSNGNLGLIWKGANS